MDTLPIVHSVFDAHHLARAIGDAFFAGAATACELFSKSWTDVYRVFTPAGIYSARIWRAGFHDDARIDYECRFLAWAVAQGFAVPDPQRQRDGGFLLHLPAPEGRRTLALFPWAEGSKIGTDMTGDDAAEMGAWLARLHLAGQSCPIVPPDAAVFHRPLEKEIAALADALRHRAIDAAAILDGVRRVMQQVADTAGLDLPRGVLHGDFHASNMLRRPDGSLYALDFDDVAPGLLVRDLAATRWSLERMGRGKILFDAFLAGYRRLRSVDEAEFALMPLFLAERDAWVVKAWGANVNMLGDAQGMFDQSLRTALERFAALA